jgi:hypothetical protein
MQRLRAFLEDNVVAIVVIAIVVLIAMGGIAWTLVAQAKWDTSVAEANTRALQDTVRVYQGIAQGLEGELGEKTRAATLMQEQRTIDSDSIADLGTALGVASAALKLSQRALSRAEVAFDSLVADIEADSIVVVEETGDRIATFTVVGPPIEGTAKVTVPPEESPRRILFQPALTVSPFRFTYALGCTPQFDAVVTFESPSWVRMTPQPGIVAPEICHGDRPTFGQGFKISFGSFGIGAGVGATITAILFGVLGGS